VGRLSSHETPNRSLSQPNLALLPYEFNDGNPCHSRPAPRTRAALADAGVALTFIREGTGTRAAHDRNGGGQDHEGRAGRAMTDLRAARCWRHYRRACIFAGTR
jgi:hypothetical protein